MQRKLFIGMRDLYDATMGGSIYRYTHMNMGWMAIAAEGPAESTYELLISLQCQATMAVNTRRKMITHATRYLLLTVYLHVFTLLTIVRTYCYLPLIHPPLGMVPFSTFLDMSSVVYE